jgi:hypothetical protein
MTSLIVWCLMMYGMTNIGVYGKILNNFRNKIELLGNNPNFILYKIFHFIREMMNCMMCLSFHLGYIIGIFFFSPVHEYLHISNYTSWFLDGCMASGITWIINSIVEWFEENRPNHYDNINNNQIL